ncbi:branched-chain amino acid ABC transporter ATP-binding protein/permease [Bradyrhizobium archetypum]|uniref:ATP-binding cassette domain-containing protein n=1 Tax=Bradyrhizobium archetypum TaxID=2721160 RepID=A0A7Y4H2E4_9BRAD|nr:branched-chain amino acid ABC transporter ATP-binding protein/permease [Bradyrhizobium archetypum]NOJ45447.1 ATP-binding cassette domain-containing protein [Bradyrhizobium archetypum]
MKTTFAKYRPLLTATLAVIALPFGLYLLGLSLNTGTTVVALAIAAMGLNLCIGYTGLVSFGHGAWFGIGAYAAGLIQRNWFGGDIFLPLALAAIAVAVIATFVGFVILRRRGVYFSLLTLALSALTYTIAFRWTAVTGGEDGLGGLKRGSIGPFSLDHALNYYIAVSVLCLGVLYLLLRLVRSPFGHVLMAIRENQLRATFQGYPVERYKLGVFVISAVVTGFAGGLIGFQNYLVSAEAVSVPFSGELLAIVVIGGMRSMLGPAIGALFFILFRELFSIWTANWLLWFGLVFVAFVLYSPGGLVGIWATLVKRWRPPPEEAAAMSRRKIYQGPPLPAFLQPKALKGTVLDVRGVSKTFGGIRAVTDASVTVGAGEIHALIGPNGAGKTTLFNLVSGLYPTDSGTIRLNGREIQGVPSEAICHRGLARSFQITNLFKGLSIYENLRLSLQAQSQGRFNLWRDIDHYRDIHAETAELIKFLGLQGIETIEGGELSYGGQRLVDLGIALGSKPQVLLLDEPLAGLAAAERERVANLVKNIAINIPVLIVEHDIDRVLGFSRTVTVMNQGEVLMTDTPEAVRADRRVQEIYTGTGVPEVEHIAGEHARASAVPILRFDRVNTFYGKSHILHDATLDVREGEIVALLGRNGAGKSTLLKTLAGLVPLSSGTIEYAGADISRLPAPEIARAGIGYVPQGRGLFAGMTVKENLALGRLARKTDGSSGVVWDEAQVFDYFPRLKERMEVAADYLSGGEQQMVAVARAMSGNVKLLLLDEPFEGLAPAVILELFKVFDRLRQHISIVIVEHNLDLVLALADRVFALERGAVFHQGPAQPLLTDLEYRKKILWL